MSTQGDALMGDAPIGASTKPENPTIQQNASDAAARLTDAAQTAGRQAKDAAADLAAEARQNVKGLLNDQIAAGADLAGHVAGAARTAAQDLDPKAPQLAALVRNAATGIETFSGTVRDKSVEELFEAASDFTRRQPAAVFGAAALAGFFLFRVLKADSAASRTGPGQPLGGPHGA